MEDMVAAFAFQQHTETGSDFRNSLSLAVPVIGSDRHSNFVSLHSVNNLSTIHLQGASVHLISFPVHEIWVINTRNFKERSMLGRPKSLKHMYE